ncbi:MAG: hypothetical protein R2824_06305 [Saprospiraceae bacterium]|nr:sigma-70 family RNA polymerase sigma factor [Lewinella sp.]
MSIKKLKSESKRSAIEEQVLTNIRNGDSNVEAVNWFFKNSRDYAQQFLIKYYPNLEKFEWDAIFANVNLKFTTRIRNGIELQPGTRLTTYYTSIAKFAALDFVRDQQYRNNFQEVNDHQVIELPAIEGKLEREERAREIQAWLMRIIGNMDQVKVLLLQADGVAYKDIVVQTGYQSEGACRNAVVKGKKKIAEFLLENPESAQALRKLLLGH